MAYTQDQINAALQQELSARPGASYDAMVQQAATYGISPQEVAAAYDALYPQSTLNTALMDEVAARPGSTYNELYDAAQQYGVDANEFNKAWANMGFTNAGIKDVNKDGIVDGRDLSPADVQKALQAELAARPGSSYADLLKMSSNVYHAPQTVFDAGYNNYLQSIPKPPTKTATAGTAAGTLTSTAPGQLSAGTLDMSAPDGMDKRSNGWNDRHIVGASNGQLMGAGSQNYNSSLIKSLRQNSMTPISTNPGIQISPNVGQESSNWTPPVGVGTAFNPQPFNSRAATPQEVSDWNAYQAYRVSSVNGSNPYMSLTDWITAGRPGAGGSSGNNTNTNNNSSNTGNNQGGGGDGP